MFVGRVNIDISDIFDGSGDEVFSTLFWSLAFIIISIVVVSMIHYTAVMFYLIDVPICLLNAYLVKELKDNIEKSK